MRDVLTDEQIAQAIAALDAADGNARAAADTLGVTVPILNNRLTIAAERGLLGTDAVLPGYHIKQVTTHDKDGSWVKQTKKPGEVFEMPEGLSLKGVTAYTDSEGRVLNKYVMARKEAPVLQDVLKAIKEEFDGYKGAAELSSMHYQPSQLDPDKATVYMLSDHHLGLYSWAEETGEDYDLAIGEKLLMDAMTTLVQEAPLSETAVILNLGDFFHSQGNENRTPKSGNILDVDTRYAKVLRVGVSLMIRCIELALQKHKTVLVRCLPGNHDPYAALALAVALDAFFHDDQRVTIDTDPSAFFWWRFGKVFVGSTHGDMIKHDQMPGVMAARRPKDWGESEYRYVYLGHVHHKSLGGGEHAGVIWETFQVLAPRDAWHQASGYSAGRSMVAITLHKERGEIIRNTEPVKGPS